MLFGKLFGAKPDTAEALKNKGNEARRNGNLAEAEALYRRSIAADAAYMPAHYNLGNVLRATGRLEEALASYDTAATIAPDDHEVHVNRGVTLTALARYEEAIAAFNLAHELARDAVEPPLNKGVALDRSGRHEEAIRVWNGLLERRPDLTIARYYRAMSLLLLGRTKEGLPEYESRLDLPGFVPHDRLAGKEQWDGSALDGRTLLIYPEQGMGDMIQFLRYVRACKQRGARTMVVCHPPLARILECAADIDIVVPDDGRPVPEDFEVYVSVMSLPYVIGEHATPAPLALDVPVETLAEINGARGLKVGVCWQGSRKHDRDAERSIAGDVFWQALGGIDNVTFFNLQVDGEEDCHAIPLAPYIHDFRDTASLLVQLDLVITVDTSVAHLSATLGVPTWVLVTHSPDWRWGIEGSDTPWYPSVRLYRQPQPGNWSAVLGSVRDALIVAK